LIRKVFPEIPTKHRMSVALLSLGRILLSLAALGAVALIPFGLPGNLLIALLAVAAPFLGASWTDFWILAAAGAVAELAEFLSSLGIAKGTGAGRTGLWGAFLGGIAGAVLLTPVVPPLGTLFGAALGSFAGAALFEWRFSRRSGSRSLKIGFGAFLGTLLGRLLKLWLAVFQVVWLSLALWS